MAATSRRRFLRSSAAAAGAAAFAAPAFAPAAIGANDKIRVGLVGLGGRMSSHVASLAQMTKDVEIVALCDCDEAALANAAARYPQLAGKKLTLYTDQKKLFDDQGVDAVSFATQDHWHALQTIWACRAGKHVYVEKPCAHTLREGRKMVEAARRYDCMVQHGTQCRSSPNIREGIQKLKEGIIGEVYMARGMSYKLRGHLGKDRPREAPKGLDWEKWVGPSKMVPYSSFHHRRWYWCSNFGSGDIANQTVHNMDIMRWGLGLNTHPTKIQSMGGRYVPAADDDADTPNTQTLAAQWAGRDLLVQFEIRHWYTPTEAGMGDQYPFVDHGSVVGVIFFGTKGYMIFPDYSSYRVFLGPKREPGPFAHAPGEPMMDLEHFQNWIAAVRSGKHTDLNADVEEGHLSTAVSHLAKIACRLGRTLDFDPAKERFVNDPEADQLLSKEYRPGYEVPEKV